ncbi:MAG TPA: hypothetical protein VLD58_08955, partial [Gemmatimonadales bacterium]|nr:hypothetical protein [Gemmatimonadales bacterium]
CGVPVRLDAESEVAELSHEVIDRLREATVATTYHLEAYLSHHPSNGLDAFGLRRAIEERGGRVLESGLRPPADLDPRIAWTLRHQFVHFLEDAGIEENGTERAVREREPVA